MIVRSYFFIFLSGGCTGFSTNINAVKRWEINATYRAALRTCFHHHLNYSKKKYQHPDFNQAQIKKDQQAVHEILHIISTTFIDPLSAQPLMSISIGILVSDKVTHDMLSAKDLVKIAMEEFVCDRLGKERAKCFYDPIKLMKLGTFATMNKTKNCKVNSRIVPLQAMKDLFAKISFVAQIRSIDMRSIFQFPLGPLSWALAEPIGSLKKTSKAALLHKLEGKVHPIESIQGPHMLIVDGMAYVQQTKVADKTFGHFALDLLQRILVIGVWATRIDVIFDDYHHSSIKNIERSRWSARNLLFQSIVSSTASKQWGLFCQVAKTKFICNEWRKEEYRNKIRQKDLYVMDGVEVIKLSSTAITTIKELNSNHEETDTRMVSHANHASSDSNPIVIASPDTDVFVICLAFQHIINSDIFFLTGVKNSRRTIDISAVAENIFVTFNLCKALKEMIMESLIGLHSFIGCDTTSAFAGRGKVKPLTLMLKDQDYVETFSLLGKEIHLQEELIVQIKRFVCHMYGWNSVHSLQ